MRTRKEVRDMLHTQAFFDQGSGSICPCGLDPCPLQSGGTKRNPLAGTAQAAANMEEACRQFDEMTQSLEEQCTIDEVDEEVNLDRENIGKKFELRDLKGVLLLVDSLEEAFRREHNRKMVTVKTTLAETQLAATISCVESLSGNLNRIVWRYREWNEVVGFSLCIVQLRSLEKRFSLFREDCRDLRRQAEECAGEKLEPVPPTLRKVFSDPTKMLRDDPPRKDKRQKARDIKIVLGEIRRLIALLIKDVQGVTKSTPNGKAKLPSVPANLTYDGCKLSEAIPLAIRQSAYDLAFTCDEMQEMRGRLLNQREMVRCAMMIWVTTSTETWEYGKAHIHEFSDMRKYEYMRISLRATYLLAFREEVKIMTYILSDDRPKGLCQQLEIKLLKKGRDIGKLSAEWDERVRRFELAFVPLEDMVEQLNEYSEDLEEAAKMDGWRSQFRNTTPPSKPV